MSTTTTSVADALVEAMRNADWDAVVATYAPDVLLDVNSPLWRFQLQGREAAATWFAEELTGIDNLRLTEYRVHRSDSVLVIEEEMRFDRDGGEHLWRAVDIFRIDNGTVVEHTQYCTGVWDPAQIERQRREAPIVRW